MTFEEQEKAAARAEAKAGVGVNGRSAWRSVDISAKTTGGPTKDTRGLIVLL